MLCSIIVVCICSGYSDLQFLLMFRSFGEILRWIIVVLSSLNTVGVILYVALWVQLITIVILFS